MTNSLNDLHNLLRRQEQEREDAVAAVLRAEREDAAALANAVLPDAGARLAEAVAEVEAQIRSDVRAARLLAEVRTELPSWADRTLPLLDPDDVGSGRRRVVVYIPRQFGDGTRENVASALIDVSDPVFGRGAGRQRDREMADRHRRGTRLRLQHSARTRLMSACFPSAAGPRPVRHRAGSPTIGSIGYCHDGSATANGAA